MEKKANKIRLTKKFVINWVNKEFKRLEIDGFVATEMYNNNFRQNDLENGASYYSITLLYEGLYAGTMYFLWQMKYVENYLNNGYKLKIEFKRIGNSFVVPDSEIIYTKINLTNE